MPVSRMSSSGRPSYALLPAAGKCGGRRCFPFLQLPGPHSRVAGQGLTVEVTPAHGFFGTKYNGVVGYRIQLHFQQLFQVQPGIARSTVYLGHTADGVGVLHPAAVFMRIHHLGTLSGGCAGGKLRTWLPWKGRSWCRASSKGAAEPSRPSRVMAPVMSAGFEAVVQALYHFYGMGGNKLGAVNERKAFFCSQSHRLQLIVPAILRRCLSAVRAGIPCPGQ